MVTLAGASIVGEGFMGVNFLEDFANVGNKGKRTKFPGVLGTLAPDARPKEILGSPGYRFPSKGQGWYNDPYRHALAARGMRTNIRSSPFPSRYSKPIEESGGWFYLEVNGEEIGRIDIALHRRDTKYSFGYVVPAMTAVSSTIEIYEEKYHKHGFGKKLLDEMENFAELNGMERVWVTHVRNPEFFERMGYVHTGIGSIYEKVL